jgi:hypothetical protein
MRTKTFSVPAYLKPEFYNNPSQFLVRNSQPMALRDFSQVLHTTEPYNTSRFWLDELKDQPELEKGCPAWATIFLVVGLSLVREIVLERTKIPPSLEIYELKNILFNIYDRVEQEVGADVMLAKLDQRSSSACVCLSAPDARSNRLLNHLRAATTKRIM